MKESTAREHGPARENNQQKDKQCRKQKFPRGAIVVDHGNIQDLPIQEVDAHQGFVTCGKQLVLFQRAVQHIPSLGNLPLKRAA